MVCLMVSVIIGKCLAGTGGPVYYVVHKKLPSKVEKNPYFKGGNDALMSGVGTCKWAD